MIKITSGTLKNRKLDISEDFLKENTVRRTSNYTKQLIMNLLKNSTIFGEEFTLHDSIVADICAGTGAIGFEMISNGAKKCYFVDINPKVVKKIEYNADRLSLMQQIKCIHSMTKLKEIPDELDFVFIDPPYLEQEKIFTNFTSIARKSSAISKNTVILAECYKDQSKFFALKGDIEIIFSRKATSNTNLVGFRFVKNDESSN